VKRPLPPPEWIDVSQAARILEVSNRQVRRYVEQGLLEARRIGHRGWIEVSYADVCRLRDKMTLQHA
jgi:hypothetical protein